MTIIDNLGIKMYSNLAPVLGELISNAYDADAELVKIILPDGTINASSQIEITDNGGGMEFAEINSTYLSLGRNRRMDPQTATSPRFKRPVMGRKGIGKLASFGIADIIQISTSKNGIETEFTLNLSEIRSTPIGAKYQPSYVTKTVPAEKTGTTVILRNLSRTRAVSVDQLRGRLARRFSCISPDFQIELNGTAISPEERDLKSRCTLLQEYDVDLADPKQWRISGWIGAFENQVPSDVSPGVVIMVRGKLAQEPTFFDAPTSGWINMAKFYILGEINADFLDLDDAEDMVLTNRAAIDWPSDAGQAIQTWGASEITKMANAWGASRREKKEKVIRNDPDLSKWLSTLSRSEKPVADKIIKALTTDGELPDARVIELASFMKESFDYQVFRDLASSISENPTPDDRKVIELFREWDVIEAREVYRVAQGRLVAIEQLEKLIVTNAREVPELHQFLASYPWILDPSWTIAYDETYYSTLLKDHFREEESKPAINRRLDFICLGAGDTIHVVELKRPKEKIGVKELAQLEEYVAFVRQRLGNAPNGRSYTSASGYIIGEDIQDDFYTRDKILTLEKSRMYVKKYADLLSMAQRLHKDFADKLK